MFTLKVNDSIYTFPDEIPLNLLDAAASVTDLKVGCRKGICGICLVRVTDGIDSINERADIEKRTLATLNKSEINLRLLCQCTINGDVSICNKSL